MYRLLIVDDEPHIVNWLYELFKEESKLDLDVYRAYSGREALNWLNRAKIDIVLADIHMPGIDGFRLLEEVMRNWPKCHVIFLTGYNEFDYIYSAVKHEKVNFLLKTEDDSVIMDMVSRVISDIDENLKNQELVFKARKQMQAAIPMLQKEFLFEILENPVKVVDMKQERFDELEIPLAVHRPVILFISHIDNYNYGKAIFDKYRYIYTVKNIIQEYMPAFIEYLNIPVDQSDMLCILQPKESLYAECGGDESSSYDKILQVLKGTLESVQESCKSTLNIFLSFAVIEKTIPWSEAAGSYALLKQMKEYCMVLGTEIIITDKSFLYNGMMHYDNKYDKIIGIKQYLQKKDLVELYLSSNKQDELVLFFEHIRSCLSQNISMEDSIAQEIFLNVSLSLLSFINGRNLKEKLAEKFELDKLVKPHAHTSWQAAVDYLSAIALDILRALDYVQIKYYEDTLTELQNYVFNHLSEDISLVKLAEVVHLNPSYLSRLFKKVKGINLSDYVFNIRINKARELLEAGEMKVQDIAVAVGFSSAAYFIRFFKKAVGLSPQEYRSAIHKQVNKSQPK